VGEKMTLILVNKQISQDGSIKYILQTRESHYLEAVYFRLNNLTTTDYAFTLCLSSQAGCALNCSFCATGKLGLLKSLTSEEMRIQLVLILEDLVSSHTINPQERFHLALMGMGEPLHNYDSTCAFYQEVQSTGNLAKLSLSTVGLTPKIKALSQNSRVNYDLFLSLHSPFDEERSTIIPVNNKYPISGLIEACTEYAIVKKSQVKISYLLINGINDSLDHAHQLSKLIHPKYFAVQLLLYNLTDNSMFSRPEYLQAEAFQEIIRTAGLDCHIVISKGLDINAGCGQLATQEYSTAKKSESPKTIPRGSSIL
jgi:23S rRNA (adenine2503-C2)-methyltransferase